MKPEAKKSCKCNQQINWYKKEKRKRERKKEQKDKLDYKQLKLQYLASLPLSFPLFLTLLTRSLKILFDKYAAVMFHLYFFNASFASEIYE